MEGLTTSPVGCVKAPVKSGEVERMSESSVKA